MAVTIMSKPPPFETTLRDRRLARGWSQDELARASGLSRPGISAIETGRLVPSAAAALALAAALECRVEDLFRLGGGCRAEAVWAWPPARRPCRYWRAEVGGRPILYPAEATEAGLVPHDGVDDGEGDGLLPWTAGDEAGRTLVMAGCDPAVGLLAAELERTARIRLIPLPRASRAALDLLGRGLVHVAGVHLAGAGKPGGNADVVRALLGPGQVLIHAARWQEGIACAPSARVSTVEAAVHAPLRWVGREPGSGARQCLDEITGGLRPPRRLATDHRGVAEAVRQGWADAGVCLRLVTEDSGLDFLHVRDEDYDLCLHARAVDDPRIQALLRVLRSLAYRKALAELPGYDSRRTGEQERVD